MTNKKTIKKLNKKKKSKKIKVLSKSLKPKNILFTKRKTNYKYEGWGYEIITALMYLITKHRNLALVIDGNNLYRNSLKWTQNNGVYNLNYPTTNNSKKEYLNTIKKLENDSSKRYGVNVLFIDWVDDDEAGHYNIILYDFQKKTAERFESISQQVFNNNNNIKVENTFDKKFKKTLKKIGYKYITPDKYAPFVGIQDIEENYNKVNRNGDYKHIKAKNDEAQGYCGAWALHYVDLRLSNPNVRREKIINQFAYILKKQRYSFRRFIKNYTSKLMYFAKKMSKFMGLHPKSDKFRELYKEEYIKDTLFIDEIIIPYYNLLNSYKFKIDLKDKR